MKRFIMVIMMIAMLAVPATAHACVVETKPAIAGNRVEVSKAQDGDETIDWRNHRTDHECEGCRQVQKIKERERFSYRYNWYSNWYRRNAWRYYEPLFWGSYAPVKSYDGDVDIAYPDVPMKEIRE